MLFFSALDHDGHFTDNIVDESVDVKKIVETQMMIEALISEIQIYEEKLPNGQWLKSITFKLPIIDKDLNISLNNDKQVDT